MSESHEFEIMKLLGEIRADCAATKEAVESLAGEQGRVTMLEEAMERSNTRQWLHSAVIVPISAALHLGMKKVGL